MTNLTDIKATLEMAINCIEKDRTDEALLHVNMALVNTERMIAAEIDLESREFALQHFDKLIVYVTSGDGGDQSYSDMFSQLVKILGGDKSAAEKLIHEMALTRLRRESLLRIHHHEIKNSR
jgi:hypothetical protein